MSNLDNERKSVLSSLRHIKNTQKCIYINSDAIKLSIINFFINGKILAYQGRCHVEKIRNH